MKPARLTALCLALAIGVLAVLPALGIGANPQVGATYKGQTTTGKPITIHVKTKSKANVHYCKYTFPATITNAGAFSGAYKGPGGTYMAVKGKFVSKRKATGTMTVDFLCDAQGKGFTATK